MLIIPAIDIKDGCVVRYVQGIKDKKVYSRDPLKTAKHWVRQGAKLIHVVDLDGAFSGRPKNLDAVRDIIKTSGIPIEFGGGVRNREDIETLLDYGAYRVVLGTRAIEDPGFLKKTFKEFKNRIIISLDAKSSTLLTEGWQASNKSMDILEFVRILKGIGFGEFIYTDTTKDGTLKGPNIKGIKSLLKESGLKIIASGGISSLDDISRLKMLEKQGLTGIITGKALYEGKFTLSQALKLVQ